MEKRRYIDLRRKKFGVYSAKLYWSNFDINNEGNIEQELEEDDKEISQITDVTELNE